MSRLLRAAQALLGFRHGEYPRLGYIRDADDSREAVEELAKAAGAEERLHAAAATLAASAKSLLDSCPVTARLSDSQLEEITTAGDADATVRSQAGAILASCRAHVAYLEALEAAQ